MFLGFYPNHLVHIYILEKAVTSAAKVDIKRDNERIKRWKVLASKLLNISREMKERMPLMQGEGQKA